MPRSPMFFRRSSLATPRNSTRPSLRSCSPGVRPNNWAKTSQPLPRLQAVFVDNHRRQYIAGADADQPVAPRAFESPSFENASDFRKPFAEWLTSAENRYFARNFANRIWSVYFGRGIVDPVDDFSVGNPPSHPELLDQLAGHLVAGDFDIRRLEKAILMSDTYQRTSAPNQSNAADQRNYARQYLRPLLAEVALDAIDKALGSTTDFGNQGRPNVLAIELGTNQVSGSAGRALSVFGRGDRQSVCDCDRRRETDLRQFTYLVNDAELLDKIAKGSIQDLLAHQDNSIVATQLYLRFFGRKPGNAERKVVLAHLAQEDRRLAFNDLVWALINSREFLINH